MRPRGEGFLICSVSLRQFAQKQHECSRHGGPHMRALYAADHLIHPFSTTMSYKRLPPCHSQITLLCIHLDFYIITIKHFTLDGAENCSSSCVLSPAYATYLNRLQSYLASLSSLKVDDLSEESDGELPQCFNWNCQLWKIAVTSTSCWQLQVKNEVCFDRLTPVGARCGGRRHLRCFCFLIVKE